MTIKTKTEDTLKIPKKRGRKKKITLDKPQAPKRSVGRPRKSADPKKTLVMSDNEKSFWVTNGKILNSLIALRDALDEMEKEVYLYHVSETHNDFASWVDNVLCDSECASDLHVAKTPKKARAIINKHLKTYEV